MPTTTWGLLEFSGTDAVDFLQGQLSCDATALTTTRYMLGGLHNPQGRVLALLRLLRRDDGALLAALPAELAEPTAVALRRYILRAKVAIAVVAGPTAAGSAGAPGEASLAALSLEAHDADVRAGLPQVYAATRGEFVAQMLNLDCVGAISFSKGCYTGQEVIARAHYRGRVKRRMQLFRTTAAVPLAHGMPLTLPDGRRAVLVDATAAAPDGSRDFLAVAPLAAPGAEPASASAPAPAPDPAPATRIDCVQVPLPYALPD
jgi:folate-binding protein YgfZ